MRRFYEPGAHRPRYFSRTAAVNGETPRGFRGADAYADSGRWPAQPYTTEALVESLKSRPLPTMLAPPVYCQVVYCVEDVTAENGGTCVVPLVGSASA